MSASPFKRKQEGAFGGQSIWEGKVGQQSILERFGPSKKVEDGCEALAQDLTNVDLRLADLREAIDTCVNNFHGSNLLKFLQLHHGDYVFFAAHFRDCV